MRFTIVLLAAIVLFACNSNATDNNSSSDQTPAEAPNIQVTINGISGGTAFLVGHFADQRFRLDSTQINANGQLVFQRPEPYDGGLYFVWVPDKVLLQLLLDKDQTLSMTTTLQNAVGDMQVEGNLDNELLYKNLKFEMDINPKFDQINAQISGYAPGSPEHNQLKSQRDALLEERKAHLNDFFTQHPNSLFSIFKKAGQNPEVKDVRKADGSLDTALQVYLYRSDFWKDVDFSDERLLRTPVVTNKLQRYIKDLTPQNPDSIRASASFLINQTLDAPEYFKFFSNWITLQYDPLETTLMDPEAVFVHMIQNYFTYDRAFWADSTEVYALQLRAKEMEGSLVGNKAPNVSSTGPDGKTYSIYDFDTPYIIVYMYNPTCEHCMEQTPKLVQFYQQWKNKGVSVYAIAVDTEEQEWKDYITKSNMNFVNVFDPTNKSIYAKYYVDHTPEVYVINQERMIIAKNLKVNQIAEVIQRDQNK
ncbi:MAG: redoxin domain-containing protein [Chitinophagales bacterium]|nr:redoxin domain-containing protein [Chitinophagales bacterium]